VYGYVVMPEQPPQQAQQRRLPGARQNVHLLASEPEYGTLANPTHLASYRTLTWDTDKGRDSSASSGQALRHRILAWAYAPFSIGRPVRSAISWATFFGRKKV